MTVSRAIRAKDPNAVLTAAEAATRNGDYTTALRGFLWFHRNALQYVPEIDAVRLSFALSSWSDLCDRFPPASQSYDKILERNVKRVLKGGEGWEVFQEVAAMQRYRKRQDETLDLFGEIEQRDAQLAGSYFGVVRELVLTRRQYDRYLRYVDPMKDLDGRINRFEHMREHFARRQMKVPALYEPLHVFMSDFELVLEALWARQRREEAQALHRVALDRVGDAVQPCLRRAQRAAAARRRLPSSPARV